MTGTVDGEIVVWSDRSLNNLFVPLEPYGKKAAIKFVRLHNGRISSIQPVDGKYVVSAGEDGFIRVFDTQFRILAWFEKEKQGPILSVSFRSLTDADGHRAPGRFLLVSSVPSLPYCSHFA